jgi:glycosyltransferase involved in cell wall biosynthesis
MASAVPVLFSGLGEMARIISDANAGMVVAPEQVEPLVQDIIRLADDPALARELGENGRRLCEQEFSWQKVVRRWLKEMSDHSNTEGARDTVSSIGLAK